MSSLVAGESVSGSPHAPRDGYAWRCNRRRTFLERLAGRKANSTALHVSVDIFPFPAFSPSDTMAYALLETYASQGCVCCGASGLPMYHIKLDILAPPSSSTPPSSYTPTFPNFNSTDHLITLHLHAIVNGRRKRSPRP